MNAESMILLEQVVAAARALVSQKKSPLANMTDRQLVCHLADILNRFVSFQETRYVELKTKIDLLDAEVAKLKKENE